MRILVAAALLTLTTLCGVSFAQYNIPADTLSKSEDDTTQVKKPVKSNPIDEQEAQPKSRENQDAARKFADDWIRRLLYRGWLDFSHIGGYSTYQLTDWNEGTGSYGPVQARIMIKYLGQSSWLGKDAEWIQASVEIEDEEPTVIDYDFTIPSSEKLQDIYSVLYRIDGGDVQTGSFALPDGQLDYDRADRPTSTIHKEVKMYSGTYQVEEFLGSGSNGAAVTIYRANDIQPIRVLMLGYGDKALTYIRGGSDATPRFSVPPPPGK